MSSLSKAAQMREMKKRGMTTGEIARLFGVTYHYAYQVVVIRAAARPRSAPSAADQPAVLTPGDAAALSWPQLFAAIRRSPEVGVIESKAEVRSRVLATREADDRDPSGKWVSKFEAWKKSL